MDLFKKPVGEGFVEAIEDGKIVRVTEEYAKQEGLLILRKDKKGASEPAKSNVGTFHVERRKRSIMDFDPYRRPLDWKKDQVVNALIDNFHWKITAERKKRSLTRKQVAKDIGVSEESIKMIENGILPERDFVLINKLQDYYGVSFRKDGKTFGQTMRALVEEPKKEEKVKKAEDEGESVSGDDIILED